eukprot:CAMPEP_0117652304 /NCGR_PEP_ID=MMETSP0804-20121206/2555_1 /TAXON_ID=1074897 /ORGANISM="Tetraselmis astigmatica, Strain CCMP880" /LENGTH=358 /DNA_ID=CAMNT_0005458341 /DNA_START=22 /DNA_END=1095 /DNA_ORIENTATION=+
MTYAAVSVGTPWRSHWAGAPLARLAMERGFARAPPVRSVCHILRGCRSGRLAASMSAAALPDALALDKLPPGIIGARGKVTRSALAKLKLPQLREICSSLGLGAEGKKPALVDRLYAVCSMEDSTASSETPPGDSDSNGSATAQLSSASSANSAPSAVPNVPLEQREAPSTQDTARESSWSVEPKASPVGQRAQQGVGPESFRAAPTGLSVTWLGTSSGAPTQQRNVSCVAVDLGRDGVLLVDAGEGSKRQLEGASPPFALLPSFHLPSPEPFSEPMLTMPPRYSPRSRFPHTPFFASTISAVISPSPPLLRILGSAISAGAGVAVANAGPSTSVLAPLSLPTHFLVPSCGSTMPAHP